MNYIVDAYGDITQEGNVFTFNAGQYLQGNYTREEQFDFILTVTSANMQDGDSIVIWKMEPPAEAVAETAAGRATGSAIAVSLELRKVAGAYTLNVLKENDVRASGIITLNTPYIVKVIAQYSNNNGAQIAANGRIRAYCETSENARDIFDLKDNDIQLGNNAAWRYYPVWGCLPSDSEITATIQLDTPTTGVSIQLNDPDRWNNPTGEDPVSENKFLNLFINRSYTI